MRKVINKVADGLEFAKPASHFANKMEPEEQKEFLGKLSDWLTRQGVDRAWLASELGLSLAAVNGWYATGSSKRRAIPSTAQKLLKSLMSEEDAGKIKFTFEQADTVRRAMAAADYHSFPEFARDAIMANADQILEREARGTHSGGRDQRPIKLLIAEMQTGPDTLDLNEEPGETSTSSTVSPRIEVTYPGKPLKNAPKQREA